MTFSFKWNNSLLAEKVVFFLSFLLLLSTVVPLIFDWLYQGLKILMQLLSYNQKLSKFYYSRHQTSDSLQWTFEGVDDWEEGHTVWNTAAPSATGITEEALERQERWRNEKVVFFAIVLVLFFYFSFHLCLFICSVLFCFNFPWRGMLHCVGVKIWRDWEMRRLRMHGVIFPKFQ